ncbi:MAG TPA: hypothetical protein VKP30_26230 [Polyangiaceae bacterium]|nr:hypothetical protein [Polyangiaceae bacterium]
MKYCDGGVPEESYWESLFNVSLILDRLGIESSIETAVELGCGHGTFTIPVARRISGLCSRSRFASREVAFRLPRCAGNFVCAPN